MSAKLAISNIAWPFPQTPAVLPRLTELGISGIEIAPSRIWGDTWKISPSDSGRVKRQLSEHGLAVAGFHSLLFDQPELGLFKGQETAKRTVAFLAHLCGVCADMGGRTLIFGSPQCRTRGVKPMPDAMREAVEFFLQLGEHADRQGVVVCIEPLGSIETDFIDSAMQALDLIAMVGHPGFGGHLDAKALQQADEISENVFNRYKGRIEHFHANDPGLVAVGSTGMVPHARLGELLRSVGYSNYISIEQRTLNPENPMTDIEQSVRMVKENYLVS